MHGSGVNDEVHFLEADIEIDLLEGKLSIGTTRIGENPLCIGVRAGSRPLICLAADPSSLARANPAGHRSSGPLPMRQQTRRSVRCLTDKPLASWPLYR